jgi:hypothetical protein
MENKVELSVIDKIVHIEINNRKYMMAYTYFPMQRWFPFKREERYYYYNIHESIEYIRKKGFVIIDNKVYTKPEVIIRFSDQSIRRFEFDDFIDAIIFGQAIKKRISTHVVCFKDIIKKLEDEK